MNDLSAIALESARKAFAAKCEKLSGSVSYGPVVKVVGEEKIGDAFVVTTCGSFRVWAHGQAGSDWYEGFVTVYETRFEPGTPFPTERVIADEELCLSDPDGEKHDDEAFASAFASGVKAARRMQKP
jgi:hypothetical protein